SYRVAVTFDRQNEIPENLTEEIKGEFDVKNVLPLGDSFSDERMESRQQYLFEVADEAFKQVIPHEIIEISKDCDDPCAKFNVKYRINFKNSVYYDDRQKNIPEDRKTYYPGIAIDWNFGIQIPDKPEMYYFDLASVPADEIYYDSNSDDLSV